MLTPQQLEAIKEHLEWANSSLLVPTADGKKVFDSSTACRVTHAYRDEVPLLLEEREAFLVALKDAYTSYVLIRDGVMSLPEVVKNTFLGLFLGFEGKAKKALGLKAVQEIERLSR